MKGLKRVREFWGEVHGHIQRVHLRPRHALFNPVGVSASGRARPTAVGGNRITKGVFNDGVPF